MCLRHYTTSATRNDGTILVGRKAAFTLAEVLITLGIIGIVAALTIPNLVANYEKKQAVATLKKTYSTLANAAKMYEAEHGIPIEQFNTQLSAEEFMTEYLNPYLRVLDECENIEACYGNAKPLKIDRKTQISYTDYLSRLSDGTFLGVAAISSGGVVFYLDVNGAKGPNYSGRDIFYVYLVNTNTLGKDENCKPEENKRIQTGFYPGSYGSCYVPHAINTRDELLGTSIHRSCNRNATLKTYAPPGDACAAVIFLDGWRIADDYPWD